ncbi:MAG: RNA polymerase sigma-70 factor (ECF subfamily) [Planctomycetota bacterium]|jgi:RNA polymerase sigma-70 factor (ECF subfamily)
MQERDEIADTIDNLIQIHGGRVLSLLGRLLGDPEDARDAYQETWCAVWRAERRLRKAVDPWPFIRKAAVGKAVDRLRKKGAERSAPIDQELAGRSKPPAEAASVDLAFLPARERTALTLFFWEGLSVREIGAELGAPEETVKTWMARGRERLREQLTKQDDEV